MATEKNAKRLPEHGPLDANGREILLGLTMRHELHYHWVKGHAENPKNNRCDEMAVAQWKKLKCE